MDKPTEILRKKAEFTRNKIVIPKTFIDKHGYYYSMEIYEDKIILRPVKKGE